MTKHQRILNFISLVRDSHPEMVNIFTLGSCLNFFCILHAVYPEAQPYFNIDHIITKIDGRYYDITGTVNIKGTTYRPYTEKEFYPKRRMSRSFGRMYKGCYKIGRE